MRLLFSILIVVTIFLPLTYYYLKTTTIISYMHWDHIGEDFIEGDEIKIIKFTCADNPDYGFKAYVVTRTLEFLKSQNKSVVEVSVTTNGGKFIRKRGTFYLAPFVEGKPLLSKRFDIFNSDSKVFARCP